MIEQFGTLVFHVGQEHQRFVLRPKDLRAPCVTAAA